MTKLINTNELKEKLNMLIQETVMEEKEPDLYFFYDNNAIQKKKTKCPQVKPCDTTRIKTRNFLTNISYNAFTEDDLFNRNFVFDVYVLLPKNLNPSSIEQKNQEKKYQETIYMLRGECVPQSFHKYICRPENFIHLNGKNVLNPKTS